MSNAELIAELRTNLEAARQELADALNASHEEQIRELTEQLAAAQAERDEYQERFRNVSDANGDILDQLWAAQAVIAEAQAQRLDHGAQGNGYAQLVERIRKILAQSPTDALQAVKEAALAEMIADFYAQATDPHDAAHALLSLLRGETKP